MENVIERTSIQYLELVQKIQAHEFVADTQNNRCRVTLCRILLKYLEYNNSVNVVHIMLYLRLVVGININTINDGAIIRSCCTTEMMQSLENVGSQDILAYFRVWLAYPHIPFSVYTEIVRYHDLHIKKV